MEKLYKSISEKYFILKSKCLFFILALLINIDKYIQPSSIRTVYYLFLVDKNVSEQKC